ncbi:hypothetical protein CVT25_000139 [Psilocybe cyanescens]|uniref:Uncharacterized protein n=1 Tax=Psilocybe cyanescens TaxID=93625 RepID=A0A409XH51_PSICY|nr:hypothetical protein CVT25_000139 [Psilocybe cyanescens]
MPHFLRHIAFSFTRNFETNQLKTPIFDTPLTDQTVEELETLQREILIEYNKTIDQKEMANRTIAQLLLNLPTTKPDLNASN